jgi:hypothetical protein
MVAALGKDCFGSAVSIEDSVAMKVITRTLPLCLPEGYRGVRKPHFRHYIHIAEKWGTFFDIPD